MSKEGTIGFVAFSSESSKTPRPWKDTSSGLALSIILMISVLMSDVLPSVFPVLLTRGRRDMPSLIAMLDALDRHSLATKRPVTVPMARDLLRSMPGAQLTVRGRGARAED